uniref:ABC transporter domain-containing protein n=1 Tax=viral metagenome TaxID=1070528 RepID=A0A6C0J4J1_9ZZZZ
MTVNLSIDNYSLTIAGKQLLKNTKLIVAEKNKYALIGKNGVGKSTFLLDLKTKFKENVCYYVSQDILTVEDSVFDHILSTNKPVWKLKKLIESLEDNYNDNDNDTDTLEELYTQWDCNGYRIIESHLHGILYGLGFSNEQQQLSVNSFSGGWKMRISLAFALFIEAPILLLDEPTNHLDMNGVIWLMNYLETWQNTLIIVSHDTAFINICDNIILMESNKLSYYRCRYSRFLKVRQKEIKIMQKKWTQYSKDLRMFKKKGKDKKSVAEYIKKI